MRSFTAIGIALLALLTPPATAAAQTRLPPEEVESSPLAEVAGLVTEVSIDSPDHGEGVWLEIETLDGETVLVDAGPVTESAEKRLRLKPGDRITVEGDWRSDPGRARILVAHRVISGGDSIEIQRPAADPGDEEPVGTVPPDDG